MTTRIILSRTGYVLAREKDHNQAGAMAMAVKTIDVAELAALMRSDAGIELIDVRTPAEYETVHAVGARLSPLDRLDAAQVMATRNGKADSTLYVICKAGGRSAKACELFMEKGYQNVVSVTGGTDAWVAAGLPAEKGGRNVLPLDRQIQMTAGLICLTGVTLGAFVNPWWYLLCAMVACGLTMAGLTGFCPMAIVMARMPWNQGKTNSAASCCAMNAAKAN
jgi:rhodanese-related sulfurtransferase